MRINRKWLDGALAKMVGAIAFVFFFVLIGTAANEESINALIEWWNQ